MSKTKILLVDDEEDFGFILKQYLEMSGFEVFWFQNPLDVFKNTEILKDCEVAILDVMMPNMDGFTLAKKLKESIACPFLFLTAKNQQIDRILGLKLGADDYISKPCDPEELILRLKNILKRQTSSQQIEEFNFGLYSFKPKHLTLYYCEKSYLLTEREVDLLLLLIKHNNQVITRDLIMHNIWKTSDYFIGRSMDVFISRLRKYFQHDERIKIQSIRGVGFQINFPINK